MKEYSHHDVQLQTAYGPDLVISIRALNRDDAYKRLTYVLANLCELQLQEELKKSQDK